MEKKRIVSAATADTDATRYLDLDVQHSCYQKINDVLAMNKSNVLVR